MSYQTGSSTDPVDLLQKLVTWLEGIGWNCDLSEAEGAGWRAHLDLGGNFVHLRAALNEAATFEECVGNANYSLNLYMGTAFDGTKVWNNQVTGAPTGSGTNPIGVGMPLSAGPYANYYFFADSAGENVVVVVERLSGMYVFLGWGASLNKAGSWTGGPYFFATCSGYFANRTSPPSEAAGFGATSACPFSNADALSACCAFVRADVDSFTGRWIGLFQGTNPDMGFTGKHGDSSVCRSGAVSMNPAIPVFAYEDAAGQFQWDQTSEQDGRANLLPLLLWALRDGTTTGYSLLGCPPFIFATNAVGTGFSATDEYEIGATTYMLFPNFAIVKQ